MFSRRALLPLLTMCCIVSFSALAQTPAPSPSRAPTSQRPVMNAPDQDHGREVYGSADSNYNQVIRDPGFSQWVMYLIAFLWIVDRLRSYFTKEKPQREISGSIVTHPGREPANKEDVEEIDNDLEELRDHIDAKFAEISKAGQEREERITQKLETKLDVIRRENSDHIKSLQERIQSALTNDAAHTEAITTLKGNAAGQGNQISQILQRLPQKRSTIP